MPPSREELLRVIREVLAPLVKADGGKLYVVEAADDRIRLHLGGRYSGCPGNTLATRRIIEPAIWAVSPNIVVTVTAGALIPKGAELVEG